MSTYRVAVVAGVVFFLAVLAPVLATYWNIIQVDTAQMANAAGMAQGVGLIGVALAVSALVYVGVDERRKSEQEAKKPHLVIGFKSDVPGAGAHEHTATQATLPAVYRPWRRYSNPVRFTLVSYNAGTLAAEHLLWNVDFRPDIRLDESKIVSGAASRKVIEDVDLRRILAHYRISLKDDSILFPVHIRVPRDCHEVSFMVTVSCDSSDEFKRNFMIKVVSADPDSSEYSALAIISKSWNSCREWIELHV